MKSAVTVGVGLILGLGIVHAVWAAPPVPSPSDDPEINSKRITRDSPSTAEPLGSELSYIEDSEDSWCDPCCRCSSCLLRHGLPHPRHSRCDMPQHLPYQAEPRFYYYFRPYNWFHLSVQQDDVQAFGGDRRHPYDNRIFQQVYQNLRLDEAATETVTPPIGRQSNVRRKTGEVRPASSSSAAADASNRGPALPQGSTGTGASVVRYRSQGSQSRN